MTYGRSDARQLAQALEAVGVERAGIEVQPHSGGGPDLVLTLADGQRLSLELERLQLPLPAGRPGTVQVLVGSKIPADLRRQLREQGLNYFDRSGHLRLVGPQIVIDADVPTESVGPSPHPLDSATGRDVAIACLVTPKREHKVREVARWIGRDPGGVSRLMGQLRQIGLLRPDGRPVTPDLFNELSDRWIRTQLPLSTMPEFIPDVDAQLRLGLGDLAAAGWALTDTVGAQIWGAPVVARGDYPPDFYVPDSSVLRRAVRTLGRSLEPEDRACTVAVPPAPVACRHRAHSDIGYPLASHVVVALDLSLDRARGAEALRSWRPRDVDRVW